MYLRKPPPSIPEMIEGMLDPITNTKLKYDWLYSQIGSFYMFIFG